jgi:hypothetical protein
MHGRRGRLRDWRAEQTGQKAAAGWLTFGHSRYVSRN